MAFTNEQIVLLKAAILANPTQANNVAIGDYEAVAKWLNNETNDLAWTDADIRSVDDAPDYSTFDALSAGKRDSWARFLGFGRDFSRNKVRKWITDVWGNATAGTNAEAILLAGTRNITRAEKIIGGNSATTGTVTAIKPNWTGTVSVYDIGGIVA